MGINSSYTSLFRNRKAAGFTIVELLIVVVVVAILAAITVVSYNGITSKAHDSAIISDLHTFKNKIEIYYANNGQRPGQSDLLLDPFGMKVTKGSYAVAPTTTHNLLFCYNNTDVSVWAVVALSKSGKRYLVTHNTGPAEYSGAWNSSHLTLCAQVNAIYNNNMRGYASDDTTTGPWRSFVGGN